MRILVERAMTLFHKTAEPVAEQLGFSLEAYCARSPVNLQIIMDRLQVLLDGLGTKDAPSRVEVMHASNEMIRISKVSEHRLLITVSEIEAHNSQAKQCGFLLENGKGAQSWQVIPFQGKEVTCNEQCQHVFGTVILPVLHDSHQKFTDLEVHAFNAQLEKDRERRAHKNRAQEVVLERVSAAKDFVSAFNATGVIPTDFDQSYN